LITRAAIAKNTEGIKARATTKIGILHSLAKGERRGAYFVLFYGSLKGLVVLTALAELLSCKLPSNLTAGTK
jgi:hypothetical protein